MRADKRIISRRGFLLLTGGAAATGLVACGVEQAPAPERVWPESPRVAAVERDRRAANARTTTVSVAATIGDVDLGGIGVRTWTYGGELPGKECVSKRGDLLRADLSNTLPQPTTNH